MTKKSKLKAEMEEYKEDVMVKDIERNLQETIQCFSTPNIAKKFLLILRSAINNELKRMNND